MSERPLSERVPDLGPADPPPDTDDIRWRRATNGDAAAIHQLYRAAAAVDHPHYQLPLDTFEQWLESSWIDLDRDTVLAEAGGVLIAAGFVDLDPGQESLRRVILDGVVHPQWRTRGVGTQLIEWQQRRGVERLRALDAVEPGWLMVWAEDASTARDLAERAGLRVARYFLTLERELGARPDVPQLHADYRIAQYTEALQEPTRLARNAVFRDHWSSQPTTEERWSQFVGGAVFREDLSFVALDGDGSVAGFVLAECNPDETEANGYSTAYIALVGVEREHRRRGIAPALLARTLDAAAAAGLDRAALDVDSDSPTGALGLYERVGFRAVHRSVALTREW